MNHLNSIEAESDQRAKDVDVEWKCKFDVWVSRYRARKAALPTAAAGPAPYVALVSVGGVLTLAGPFGDLFAIFIMWFSTLVLSGAYIVIVGYGSVWIAHRFAYGTTVPVEHLARGLVWTANLSLWGWGLVGLLFTR